MINLKVGIENLPAWRNKLGEFTPNGAEIIKIPI